MIGGLELNEATVEVSVDGEPVRLTPIEYKILLLLMKSPGRVFRQRKFTSVYGMKSDQYRYDHGPYPEYP